MDKLLSSDQVVRNPVHPKLQHYLPFVPARNHIDSGQEGRGEDSVPKLVLVHMVSYEWPVKNVTSRGCCRYSIRGGLWYLFIFILLQKQN